MHLEEDAAKLNHLGESGRIHGADRSWVDFNRCGTPLVEIVTEPDIHSAGQARDWLIVLRETLRQLGVSDVDMSQGSLRCDANVSVRRADTNELGTKTELKNMNSFAFLERGIEAEIERQIDLLRGGDTVVQETLHFDPRSDRLTPLRSKEEAHDYRYFPEPDLVPLVTSEEMLKAARSELPTELPTERAARFERELGLSSARARELVFRPELGEYFERVLAAAEQAGGGDGSPDPVEIANWIPQLVTQIGPDADPAQTKVAPEALAELVAMVKAKTVSRDAAREVLVLPAKEGGNPRELVEREGLGAISAGEDGLSELVDQAIAADPNAAEQVRSGNMRAIGPLVGYVMRETKGRAEAAEVRRLLLEQLDAE